MDGPLGFPTLLSHALVAFTVEFDNEAERRLPHRTTDYGHAYGHAGVSLHAPWLVSMAMWFNCMRWLEDDGLTVRELENRARTPTNLGGMERWGYVTVVPGPTDRRAKPPSSARLVRATSAGRMAQKIWRPLVGVVEQRWRDRFGGLEVDTLEKGLRAIVRQLDPGLPDCMPILKYGLLSKGPDPKLPPVTVDGEQEHSLPALFAKVLLALAMDFERESHLSLAICANLLRVLNEKGVNLRDLPILTGVSRESISMAMGIVRKARLVSVEKGSSDEPWLLVRLTSTGVTAQQVYRQHFRELEKTWKQRFGQKVIEDVRKALEGIVGDVSAKHSLLFQGIEPAPGNWRAMIRRPKVLPDFPMVLHRGGWPDGV